MKRSRFLTITFIVVLFLTLLQSTVYAASNREAVVSQQTTTIRRGQTVEDVVVLGHNVVVAGNVSEIIVVVNGDIHLKSKSRTGIVVDLGGTIKEDPGAEVNALYHMSLHTPFWNGALFGAVFSLLLWAGMLTVAIGLMVLAALITLGLRRRIEAAVATIETSLRRVGLVGLLMTLTSAGVIVISAMTIVGLPVAVLVIILYLVTGLVGFAAFSVWAGKILLRHSQTRRPLWLLSLIGSGAAMAGCSIPYFGLCFFLLVWIVGIGATSVWIFNWWRTRNLQNRQARA